MGEFLKAGESSSLGSPGPGALRGRGPRVGGGATVVEAAL